MASRTVWGRLGIGFQVAMVLGAALLAATGCEDQAVRFNQMGLECYHAGDYTKARAAFEEAIAINPDVGEYYFNRGACEQSLGHYDMAVHNYEMAVRLSPSIVQAFQNEAQCYLDQQNPEKAQEVLLAGTLANPYTAEAFINVANFFLSRGDQAGARLWFAKAIAADPDNPRGHREYGLFLARTGDRQKAIEELRRSLNLAPAQPDVSARLSEMAPAGPQLPPPKPLTK
jgi:tetratricopeptide (TPR) repeat protein